MHVFLCVLLAQSFHRTPQHKLHTGTFYHPAVPDVRGQYVSSDQLELFVNKDRDRSLSLPMLKNDNEEFASSFSDNGSKYVINYEVNNSPIFALVTNIYENVASVIDGSRAQNGENINIYLRFIN